MRNSVEKIDHARFERILRTHHEQAVVEDEVFQDGGVLSQVLGGKPDVGSNRFGEELLRPKRWLSVQQGFD